MSWKPIVAGVDESPEAAGAAAFALRMAERAGTSCQLVHAIRDAIGSLEVPDAGRYREALADDARRKVEEALRHRVSRQALERMVIWFGNPAAVLKRAGAGVGAELLVLGGKHRSALGRWFAGSMSLSLARITDVPMLVTAGAPAAVRRVLAAVDVSGAARPTLANAERFASLFGAELRALNVVEPLPVIPEVTLPHQAAEYYALTEELLQRDVWSLIRAPGVERVTRVGFAVETILQEATEWQADLLVVGSHGKGWAERVLVGSVTERLLNQLPTSLVVVPVSADAAVPAAPAELVIEHA